MHDLVPNAMPPACRASRAPGSTLDTVTRAALRALTASFLLAPLACGDDLPTQTDDTTSGTTGAGTGSTGIADGTGTTTGEAGSSDEGGPLDPEELEWPLLDCDPIVPEYCAFPFPSNVFTVADEGNATGRRLQIPVDVFTPGDAEPWTWSDGFSPSSAIMTFMPGATEDGLPGHQDFDASTADGSPTVLLDAETGERIPHWSELDYSASDPERRALFIRPATRLPGGRRYIVAIRDVVDAEGATLPASPAFAALRDGTEHAEDDSVDARRALYGDIFARLADAGVERASLQLAWDFHVGTDDNLTGRVLHMRDEAFAALGDDGSPPYTLDTVDTNWNPADFMFRIEGTFEAPLYLVDDEPNASRMNLDADGVPQQNGTMLVPFWVIIPNTAMMQPAAIVQHGHGLLGSGQQIESSHFREVSLGYNYAFIGIDWIGMADEDEIYIAATVTEGNSEGLARMTDRMQQGALNQLLAMRLAWAGLANDPMLAGLLDPDQRYYYGISQGGILGGVYMATTTEVERGVLDVMGQPYNTLLTRSVDFDYFFDLMRIRFPDPLDLAYVLGVLQVLWDRAEPTGYSHRIIDPLPNTPPHDVLMTAALGDHQVNTLGAHHMARSAGVVHLDSGLREIWELPMVQDSHEGSALVEYDFGLPPDPVCNLPQTACDDPHGRLRRLPEARDQIDEFLRNGVIANFCPGGVCSFPDQGGCMDGEMTPDVCN